MSKTNPWAACTASNDNGPDKSVQTVICDLPDRLSMIPGEVELLARFWGDIQALSAANDNNPDAS